MNTYNRVTIGLAWCAIAVLLVAVVLNVRSCLSTEAQLDTLRDDQKQRAAELVALRGEFDSGSTSIRQTVEENRVRVADAQRQIDDTKAEIDRTKAQLAEHARRLAATESDVQKTRDDLEKSKQASAADRAVLESKLAKLLEDQTAQQAEVARHKGKMDALSEGLERAQRHGDAMQKALEQTQAELREKVAGLVTKMKRIDELEQRLESAEQGLESAEKARKDMQRQLDQLFQVLGIKPQH